MKLASFFPKPPFTNPDWTLRTREGRLADDFLSGSKTVQGKTRVEGKNSENLSNGGKPLEFPEYPSGMSRLDVPSISGAGLPFAQKKHTQKDRPRTCDSAGELGGARRAPGKTDCFKSCEPWATVDFIAMKNQRCLNLCAGNDQTVGMNPSLSESRKPPARDFSVRAQTPFFPPRATKPWNHSPNSPRNLASEATQQRCGLSKRL